MDNSLSLDSITGGQSKMKYYSTAINTDAKDDTGYLDFNSYLKVLAAQMSNQDFNDPMSDAEFMQQMASYSMMEAIGQMNTQAQISYATSLVGKAVTVSDGNMTSTGVVESVVIGDGKYSLLVNGGKYTTDQITDVVDMDMFTKARELVGKNASIRDDDDIIPGGRISDVVFKGGEGYAVINKEAVPLAALVLEEESKEEEDYSEANVAESLAASGLVNDGIEVDDRDYPAGSLTKEIRIDEELFEEDDDESDNWEYYEYENSYDPASLMIENAKSSALTSANEPAETTVGEYSAARVSAMTGSVANDDETEGYLTANADMSAANSDIPEGVEIEDRSSAIMSIKENLNLAVDEYGYIYGSAKYYNDVHNIPDRPYAEDYPEEAALANMYGTKMYDIRYIHNTDITHQIKTQIMGYSSDGKAFTDIGYCGWGKLGEVVTWADGTQRVEYIGRNGSSSWYTTSGRYTLAEICNWNNSFAGADALTPFEVVIRAASHEVTAAQQDELNRWNDIYVQNAKNYTSLYY